MIMLNFVKLSCFIFVSFCICCSKSRKVEHQLHPKIKSTHHNNKITLAATERDYKPALGEILAKDSILYSQKPGTRHLRRQLWPIMQETMDSLVNSVTAGANLFKQILVKPITMVQKLKSDSNSKQLQSIKTIKNVYLSAATPTVPPSMKKSKKNLSKKPKITKVMSNRPAGMRTVSTDYVHNYEDEYSSSPSYVIKSGPKIEGNPYADMGVSGYKHFEETVLRELEEKQEQKFEATMKTMYGKHKERYLEEELIKGFPYGGWKPIKPDSQSLVVEKSHPMSKLHTNIGVAETIKPVHEVTDESHLADYESKAEKQVVAKPNSAKNDRPTRKPKTTTNSPKDDGPNYPDYFLKNHKLNSTDGELKFIKRQNHHRDLKAKLKKQTITTTTPRKFSVPSYYGDMQGSTSNVSSIFVTAPPELSKQRSKFNSYDNEDTYGDDINMPTNYRGSIKFGDRL